MTKTDKYKILTKYIKMRLQSCAKSALCRSRRELSNAYFLAKIGFETTENEPCKVCQTLDSCVLECKMEAAALLLVATAAPAPAPAIAALVERFDIETFSDFSAK